MKKPYKSKTLIANFLAAGIALVGFADKISPEQIVLGLSAMNVMLRLITKDKIGLND